MRKTKKRSSYIFFDCVKWEYLNAYGKNGEEIMVKELKEYLSDLCEKSPVIIITNQNTQDIMNWFSEKDLLKFVHGFKSKDNNIIV